MPSRNSLPSRSDVVCKDGVAPTLATSELRHASREPKVSELDLAVAIQQQIAGLQARERDERLGMLGALSSTSCAITAQILWKAVPGIEANLTDVQLAQTTWRSILHAMQECATAVCGHCPPDNPVQSQDLRPVSSGDLHGAVACQTAHAQCP
jgi:hypothetical protein